MTRFFVALIALALSTTAMSAQQEIDNVAAFARLYGAARWFYPSDAASAVDWNRFAVHGVSRVRGALTLAELERSLEDLFTPLGPGIEIGASLPAKRPTGARDPSLIAWHYRGAGITENTAGPYSAKRMNRITPSRNRQTGSGVMSQALSADTLRGKTIRMRGRVRVADPNAQGWAGLWLRVDRDPPPTVGFFDNMQGRPVRETAWREYVIEGPVASDAIRIVFGVLTVGSMTVDVDGIELAVRDPGGNWTPLAVPDASFEAPADSGRRTWGQRGAFEFTRLASGAAHGARFARIAPQSPGPILQAVAVPEDSLETPIAGATIDVELMGALKARIPLALTDAEARAESPALVNLRAALANVGNPAGQDVADIRLADAVVAWNVFRHFYPYWGDIGVDWDARLRSHLETALNAATTRDAHLDALRMLVADVRDGHGTVRDLAVVSRRGQMPVQFRILDERLVVTASSNAAVPVGSVVTAIDGTPASTRILKETQLASGTLQWRRSRAANAVRACPLDSAVTLTIEPSSGAARDARVPCTTVPGAVEARPPKIAELQPGLWYADLTRVSAAELRPMLTTLAKARGVVFDMRGYPTDAGAAVLPHLMRTAEDSTDRWMHVSRIAQPFGGIVGWRSKSWNLRPAAPHIGGRRVFLTDGRAISYAESVMGYVRDHKLGTIIGGTTAGANGNVAGFGLPGGFSIVFTGMRVTRHDGRTPFHTEGVSPDIRLEPTLAGIRDGRDELLERALTTLQMQP